MTSSPDLQTLDGWADRLEELERSCPWPGPRPLTADDQVLLCGRDEDRRLFRQEVDQHRLVFLAGASGVGKSSLLMAGLVPSLRSSNYHVAVCRDWSGSASAGAEPAEFLARQVRHALAAELPDLPDGPHIFAHLDRDHGGKTVIVLDQFEELIRNSPDFKDRLFDLLVYLNHNASLRIVISLRSEYLHELRPLETSVKPFSLSSFFLDDIEAKYGLDVAMVVNQSRPDSIDLAAAEIVSDVWSKARAEPQGMYGARVGVLHLQALLYALHARAEGSTITEAIARSYRDEVQGAGSTARAVYDSALQEAVDVKLDRCRQAAVETGVDEYLLEGTSDLLARSVQHLSSAGYKLVRDALDLAGSTLGAEFDSLLRGVGRSRSPGATEDGRPSDGEFLALFRAVVDSVLEESDEGDDRGPDLFASRSEFAAAADLAIQRSTPASERVASHVPWVVRLHPEASPLDADPAEVTSGPMLGLAPAAVLIEELRRFAFVLAWLRETSLVRLTTPGADNAMVSLIHDGFGAALEQWSARRANSTSGALHGLTAPNGADFEWHPGPDRERLEEFDGGPCGLPGAQARLLVNLRWRGARIRADFRNVLFVNCDLRGSWFDRCRFEGVGFVNCLLDGLMFSDCAVVGAPQAPPMDRWDTRAPQFRLASSSRTAAILSRYQGGEEVAEWVLAPIPELPAVAASGASTLRVVTSLDGGLVVFGGRISALVFRGGSTEKGGTVSIRDGAGSGFDVVEYGSAGRFEIIGSVIRQVTFSTSPTDALAGDVPIEIEATGSALYQVWVGGGLKGRLRAADCTLVSVWNGSPGVDAKLVPASDANGEVLKCAYHGLVGVELEGEHVPLVAGERPFELQEVDPRAVIADRAIAMDYRRHPSIPELRKGSS